MSVAATFTKCAPPSWAMFTKAPSRRSAWRAAPVADSRRPGRTASHRSRRMPAWLVFPRDEFGELEAEDAQVGRGDRRRPGLDVAPRHLLVEIDGHILERLVAGGHADLARGDHRAEVPQEVGQ